MKKLLSAILVFVLIVSIIPTSYANYSDNDAIRISTLVPEEITLAVKGDITGDNKVNTRDISLMQKHILQILLIADDVLSAADLSADEVINTRDIAELQRIILNNQPLVALTFDDGPSVNATERIINALEKYDVKATFFVLGSSCYRDRSKTTRYEKLTNLVKRAYDLGCEIANHTMDHWDLTNNHPSDDVTEQVESNAILIESITGAKPTIMRVPYGNINALVRGAIAYPIILWSIDPKDWDTLNAESTANIVLSTVKDGDIVLMHDSIMSTGAAVETIIPALLQRGFKLVTVSEMFEMKGIELQPHVDYSNAY